MPISPAVVMSAALAAAATLSHPPVPTLIHQSVATNDRDWRAQDDFAYDEQDIKSKVDSSGNVKGEGSKTYTVLIVDGSPYRQLIKVNNEPLSSAAQQAEQAKLMQAITDRRSESAGARAARIRKYRDGRADEHLLMEQMAVAFDFRMLGQETVEGVPCFHLEAVPKPDYQPPVEKARVLKGMRGQMWIDQQQFHWVKVSAEVTAPVSFGFFVAKVNPGTRFELEQAPVDQYWLPKHFTQTVNASVFGIYGIRTEEEFRFSSYKRLSSIDLRAGLR